MEVPHPTAGWEQVGERFYRKIPLYTAIFDQELDLDNYLVAGAPYGGAIGEPPLFPTVVSYAVCGLFVQDLRHDNQLYFCCYELELTRKQHYTEMRAR
jgi:hypothetical protein